MAAGGAHRRADGPPLHPGDLRRHDHLLPEPARGACRTCRRSGPPGSSRSRGSGRSSRPGSRRCRRPSPRSSDARSRRRSQAAIERVRLRQRGEPVPAELEEKVAQADEQMFSKLREMLGLDQAIAVNVGAAPTPVDVLEFFHALGIELAELWGMSETCGVGTCNRPGEVQDRHGRTGRAGRRAQDRRRRRAARPRRLRDDSATATRPTRRPRRSTPTAGSTPGTSARSTRTASCGSSTARRRSSSTPPARTCPRPTSRPRSSRRAR